MNAFLYALDVKINYNLKSDRRYDTVVLYVLIFEFPYRKCPEENATVRVCFTFLNEDVLARRYK